MSATYATRTGHTIDCVNRAVAVLDLSGEFAHITLTGVQQEAAAVDALNTGDVECHCGPEDVIEYSDPCDACGAQPGEDCLPGCIGKAAHEDSTEPVILLDAATADTVMNGPTRCPDCSAWQGWNGHPYRRCGSTV